MEKKKAIICDNMEQIYEVCNKYNLVFDKQTYNVFKYNIELCQIVFYTDKLMYELLENKYYFENFKS